MCKALRRAAWGLTAGLMLASPALAQYAAHLPGQPAPASPTVVSYMATAPSMSNFATAPVVRPARANGSYYTPDVPRGYVLQPVSKTATVPQGEVLQPVSHTGTVASVAGLPTGYVLQAVDGQPITEPVADSHTKLEEMKVELALLSDPATFPCNLSAKLDGKAMLLRGFIPNEAVRERALQVARTGTHLVIADGLKIHPSLAMRMAGVPVDTLQQGATELLAEGFAEMAPGIEVRAAITGQITLIGAARSFEEKLAISQRLLRLNGCTSVVNQLKVTPVLKDGASLTMVTTDGLHVVPTEVAMDAPMSGTAQTMPPVGVLTSTQRTGTINAMEVPPVTPMGTAQTPSAMESQPVPRSLPMAQPVARDKGSDKDPGITQGVVTFGDDSDLKPQGKK